jgi:hypothetical protein
MKKTALVLLASLGFVSCSFDFDRNYDRIDHDMIRPFAYSFTNPEISPGDTAELRVIFSGKRVNLSDLSFRVSWNIFTNRFGNLAPRDEQNLEIIGNPQLVNTDNGHSQTLTLKFKIPDSMLYNSEVIPESLSEMALLYGLQIPDLPFAGDKKSVLQVLEDLAKNPEAQKQISRRDGAILDGLSQVFSAFFEVYIDFPPTVSVAQRARVRHTVRFHNRLSNVSGLFTNQNPQIKSIRVFTMDRKNLSAPDFNVSQAQEVFPNGDTINISVNQNKSVFMEILASSKDSVLTAEQAFSTQIANIEQYTMIAFYEGETFRKISFEQSYPTGWRNDGYSVRRIRVEDGKARIGDVGYVFLSLSDSRMDAIYYPSGRTIVGFPIKFVE